MLARGLNKLIQYRNFIQNERLQIFLSDSGKKGVIINVHRACQKTITNEAKRKGDTVPVTSKILRKVTRSDVTKFSWKTNFFCCGTPCIPDPKHSEHKKVGNVCTLSFKKTCILKTCDKRIDKGT